MFSGNLTVRLAALSSLACTTLVAGCAAPIIRSQRLPIEQHAPHDHAGPHDCLSCEGRQRLRDVVHGALPYVAGPFLHHQPPTQYAAQPATIQSPHSKFHQVQTRPVFEPRHAYSPPRPIGVHLVPVPDHSFGSSPHAPATIFPDIGLPPSAEELPLTLLSDDDDTMPLAPPNKKRNGTNALQTV
ncbi:MAG: hypothetical protein CMJ64_14755 [Planctomycetaceae bacterium]|nr:hypothetical protein [Planctomycetaceae bacterium]